MSLLEDVFLEDEAGEAQELERIIEGDEYDDRPRPSTPDSNENSEKEDEAVEDKRTVDPSAKPKRVVKNPRFILNPARLIGPRGIHLIPEHFKDFKFKGKGHEKDDLDLVLKKLEHWAYRLYPKFQFEDCLKKIETLGKKRPVMVHLQKIRSDQLSSEEPVVQRESSDEDTPAQEPEDEFDKLLQQQIELARATPAPGSVRKPPITPVVDRSRMVPKATSSPSISEDQKQRMIRNRQLAEERRLARLKQKELMEKQEAERKEMGEKNDELGSNDRNADDGGVNGKSNDMELINSNISNENDKENVFKSNEKQSEDSVQEKSDDDEITNDVSISKTNRTNVIDSSDEESVVMNESIQVDVHETRNTNDKSDDEKIDDSTSHNEKNDDESKVINESIQVGVYETRNTNNGKSDDEKIYDSSSHNERNDDELKVLCQGIQDKVFETINTNNDNSVDKKIYDENNDDQNSVEKNKNDSFNKSVDDDKSQSDIINQNIETRLDTENKNADDIDFEDMDVDFSEDF